jgi:hypothetical protein
MKLPRNPDDMESLGWQDAADEVRSEGAMRGADIRRLELERHYEWLASLKSKKRTASVKNKTNSKPTSNNVDATP